VAGSCGHDTPFQIYHLMHMTVIVLNFTRERVPSEEKETSFKIFFEGCMITVNRE
jgi:hypothetical protein